MGSWTGQVENSINDSYYIARHANLYSTRDYLRRTGSNKWYVRFEDAQVPSGVVISSAYIQVRANVNAGASGWNVRLNGQDVDNAVAPTTPQEMIDLPYTLAGADWDFPDDWLAGQWYSSPDLTAIVQEIIDRPGWSQGNALGIQATVPHVTGPDETISTWDQDSSYAPKLYIEWSSGAVVVANEMLTGGRMLPTADGYPTNTVRMR